MDYQLYSEANSAQKVTYRPETALEATKYAPHYQMVKKDGASILEVATGTGSENETAYTSLFNYEIFNLTPGSWYQLIVRAQTEAGYVSREYVFATLKADGSTIAPLTLKAIDGSSGGQRDGTSSLFSFRSSLFAQLHYIVPVSCTLFIIFLVIVVVCSIQMTHQQRQLHPQDPQHHFLLSFMTNRNRSDKVAGGGGGGPGSVAGGKTLCSNSSTSGNYTNSSGGTTTAGSCAGDHPASMMMMLHDTAGNPLTDLQGDFCKMEEARYGKAMGNGGGQHHSDSYHSLGGCGGHHELSQPMSMHLDTIKMLKSCENGNGAPLPPTSKSSNQLQYPLYNLPVPYATSAVQFTGKMDAAKGSDIYGTTTAACHYTKGQLSEMYCDNAQGAVNLVLLDQANATYSTRAPPPPPAPVDATGQQQQLLPGHQQHRGSGSHQYELPFVFKNVPGPHNESTAF